MTPANNLHRAALLALLLGSSLTLSAEESSPAPVAPSRNVSKAEAQDVERLVSQLKSETWLDREEASKGLSKLGAAALPFLPKTVSDDDPELFSRVRSLVQHAQLMINAKQIKGGDASAADLEGLIGGYTLQTPEGRIRTLDVLIKQAGRAIVPTLFKMLDSESSEAVQAKIIHELGWLGSDLEHQEQLSKFYEKAPDSIKGEALWALSSVPGEQALNHARKALESSVPGLHLWGARALKRLGDRESLPALRKLALDANEIDMEARKVCLEALMELADEDAGQIYLKALETPDLREEALKGIGSLRLAAAAPKLNELFLQQKDADSSLEIIKTLGLIGDPTAVPLLKQTLTSDNADVQMAGAHALRQMKAVEAAPDMALLLKSPVDPVRMAVMGELAALDYKDALPAIRQQAEAVDPAMRFAAAQALVGLGDPQGREKIAELAMRDRTNVGFEAEKLLGDWQMEESIPLLRERAAGGNTQAQSSLFQFAFDEGAFRDLLKSRLVQRHNAPHNLDILRSLSFLLAERGLYGRAVKIAEEAVKQAPNDVDMLRTLNYSLHEVGRYAECDDTFQRMEALQNPEAEYFNSRAWFYCTAFSPDFLRPGPALALSRRAAAMEPYEGHIADTLGWALFVNKRFDESARELRRALDLRDAGDLPQRSWQRTRIARALWFGGHQEEALAEAARAAKDAPTKSDVWFELAGFFASIGKRDEAVHALHTSIELGWIHTSAIRLNPEFKSIQDDPGYRFALQRSQTNQARMEAVADELQTEVNQMPVAKNGRRGNIRITADGLGGLNAEGLEVIDPNDMDANEVIEETPEPLGLKE